jgi:hypothetical protein
MSLFFAYTKPKADRLWPGAKFPQLERCPDCRALIEVGAWPFCPHDRPKKREEGK